MVVYTVEQRWEVGLRSTYRRCRFWQKKKKIFSDGAHFDLGGYINKQNCRIGAQKTCTHTLKSPRTQNESLFGFWSRGTIWPLFFENEQGEAVTVNGDCYRAILNEFLFTKIEEQDIDNIWFQQDGATLDYYLWGSVKCKC